MSYVGTTALNTLWQKIVALLASKADRNSVYSKAEINYIVATHDWSRLSDYSSSNSISTSSLNLSKSATRLYSGEEAITDNTKSGEDEVYVHLAGAETITGAKTFSASGNLFYSGGLRVRSTSTSYSATLANSTAANTTVFMPTNTEASQYLLSRQSSSTVANTVPYYTGTNGAMGTKNIATNTLSESSNEIPTSAAIISYLRSKGLIS